MRHDEMQKLEWLLCCSTRSHVIGSQPKTIPLSWAQGIYHLFCIQFAFSCQKMPSSAIWRVREKKAYLGLQNKDAWINNVLYDIVYKKNTIQKICSPFWQDNELQIVWLSKIICIENVFMHIFIHESSISQQSIAFKIKAFSSLQYFYILCTAR